jgi:hypothetical protein
LIPDPPLDTAAEQAELLEYLPRLSDAVYGVDYTIESISTTEYNCLAWAMSDCSRFWSGSPMGGYFWPDDLPIGVPVIGVIVEMFRRAGYAECGDSTHVVGAEKVAIYADSYREVLHVARQVPNGRWASKMGALADIEHATVELIECNWIGQVAVILCRPLNVPEPAVRLILPW